MTSKFTIVTGASTGIGRAIAIAFGKKTYNTLLVARSQDKLEETKKLVEAAGGTAEIIVSDLSNLDSINQLISKVKELTAQVDILVNVAGIWHGKDEVYAQKDFQTFDQQAIIDTLMVGTMAPTLLSHAFIPLMPSGGKIINISGTFENGAKGWLPYYVSKRAIEDLTVGLSEELIDKNIQVNAISPSDTATEQYKKYFPEYLDEAVSPEEIANQVMNLSSAEKKVTGKVFVVKKDQPQAEGFHS